MNVLYLALKCPWPHREFIEYGIPSHHYIRQTTTNMESRVGLCGSPRLSYSQIPGEVDVPKEWRNCLDQVKKFV